jgi:LmbE family N-acetylglucosaminyl deacetylase
VIIPTFFSGDLPAGEPVSWLAQRNLRAWGLEGQSGSAFAARREEDQAAAARLGAQTLHLDLLDAMFRRRVDGGFYYTENTVGIPIDPEDAARTCKTLEEQLRELQQRYDNGGGLWVFAPLGISRHVDHLLVRDAAQAVFRREQLLYYEELPYAVWQPEWPLPAVSDPAGFAWASLRLYLRHSEIQAWIEATSCYVSQMTGLYPRPVERAMEILRTHIPFIPETAWKSPASKVKPGDAERRGAQLVHRYIHRTGGVNCWFLAPQAGLEDGL